MLISIYKGWDVMNKDLYNTDSYTGYRKYWPELSTKQKQHVLAVANSESIYPKNIEVYVRPDGSTLMGWSIADVGEING